MSRTGIETIISLSPNFLYVLYVLSQRALPDISLFGRLLTTTAGYAQPAHNSAGRLFAISDKLTAVTKVLEPSLGNSDLATVTSGDACLVFISHSVSLAPFP